MIKREYEGCFWPEGDLLILNLVTQVCSVCKFIETCTYVKCILWIYIIFKPQLGHFFSSILNLIHMLIHSNTLYSILAGYQ